MKTKYLVSMTRGLDPVVYQDYAIGFISASSKGSAIAQVSKLKSLPAHRLKAETKTDLGSLLWETNQEFYFNLPNICQHPECSVLLHGSNKHGYCLGHREKSEVRKNKRRTKHG